MGPQNGRKSWNAVLCHPRKLRSNPDGSFLMERQIVQRADIHKLLFDLASSLMTLRLNSRVVAVDPCVPSVTLQTGEVVTADLVIGADGVRSTIREVVMGGPDKPLPTGDAAYRAIIPTELMQDDPELRMLIDAPGLTIWLGPGKHIVGYCIVSY